MHMLRTCLVHLELAGVTQGIMRTTKHETHMRQNVKMVTIMFAVVGGVPRADLATMRVDMCNTSLAKVETIM